jgi:ubiquinone/menaquinone biosynthesis C-methylase UbiE
MRGVAVPDAAADKQAIAALFTATSASHDTVGTPLFRHFGSLLVEHIGLSAGDRVLDVAAGTGATLFPAASRVREQGRVVAVDLAPGMVDQLIAAIASHELTNADALVADAEELPFSDGSFDAVICGFALFFFPDTERALGEFRRVLRNAGRLAISTFTAKGSASIAGVWERLSAFVAPPPPAKDQVDFDEPWQLFEALEAAGFTDIVVEESPFELVLADFDAWWAWLWTMEFREQLERLDEATLKRLRESVRAELTAQPGAPEIRIRMDALLTVARKL